METIKRKKPHGRSRRNSKLQSSSCVGGDRSAGQLARDFDLTEIGFSAIGDDLHRCVPASNRRDDPPAPTIVSNGLPSPV